MNKFVIEGGNVLMGETTISCAKNAVLPILAGSILCDSEVILENFPFFEDTINMVEILKNLGAKSYIKNKNINLDMTNLCSFEIKKELSVKLRASIFCLGALIGRFGKAKISQIGGCDIGIRPIDLHLKGLKCLGVKVSETENCIYCDGKNIRCGDVFLEFASVGATENLLMASVLLKGRTRIFGCAKEPEIVDLQNFLNSAGAKISGAGSDCIVVDGVEKLNGTQYLPISDRIITGTYLIACASCGGEIVLKNARVEHLTSLLEKLENNDCKITAFCDRIVMQSKKRVEPIKFLETKPYPLFPTDLQSQMVVMLSQCKGQSCIVENLFESRFNYVRELKKMGANIKVVDNTAIIKGVKNLVGTNVVATDLRGGAGLVIAGLMAQGQTQISNISQIDRGYEAIEKDLTNLGANIKRI